MALVYYHAEFEQIKATTFLQLTMERKYAVLSKYTCISIAFFSVVWNFSDQSLNTLQWFVTFSHISILQNRATEVASSSLPLNTGISTALGNFLVYVFLWLPENIFDIYLSLQFLHNICLKVFSFFVLILFFLFGVSLLCASLIKV